MTKKISCAISAIRRLKDFTDCEILVSVEALVYLVDGKFGIHLGVALLGDCKSDYELQKRNW